MAQYREAHAPIRTMDPVEATQLLRGQKQWCFPATQAPKNDDFLLNSTLIRKSKSLESQKDS